MEESFDDDQPENEWKVLGVTCNREEMNNIHKKVQKKNLLSLLPFQIIFLHREVKRVLHWETVLLQLLEEETKLLLQSGKLEQVAHFWQKMETSERKLKDHHGVKSDVMNALLCIDVNPHLCIVGRDHRLPYWNLAQGPAPCQIGLKKRKYKVEEWKWWLPRSTGECIIRTVKVEIVKVLRWKSQVEKKRMNILESESWVT